MDYEVLLEIGVSKEIIRVRKENLEGTVKSKPSGAVCGGPYLRPYNCVPKTKNTYILKRWSTQWNTFVDFNKDDDLKDAEYQNVKTKRYICAICIVLSQLYSTKYNFLLAVLPFYRYSKIEDGYI